MKKLSLFFLLAFLALTLHSCLEGYNDATPVIRHSLFLHNWQDSLVGDTLFARVVDNQLVLDTISVGDSVQVVVEARSYANSLVSLVFSCDSDILRLNLPGVDASGVLDTARCDIAHGKYVFKPFYSQVTLPVRYYATKAGKSPLKMTVTSDANPDRVPNTYTLEYIQPVR